MWAVASARWSGTLRSRRPRACTEAPRAEAGRSPVHPPRMAWRVASGSLRTYADDGRAGEVGQAHSTEEGGEQDQGTGSGGTGGKGPGQEEPARARHGSDAEPRAREQCAGAGTASGATREGGEVHGATAPRLCSGHAEGGVLRVGAGRGPWGGRADVAVVRGVLGGKPAGADRATEARSVSGESGAAGIHPEGGRE